jgi:hypothetical protein
MKRLVTAFLIAGACAGTLAATPEGSLAWLQPIVLSVPGAAIYRFELPAAAYGGSRRTDLGDVRIVNGAGEVVPHAWVGEAPVARLDIATVAVTFFALHQRPGEQGLPELTVAVRQGADGALVSAHLQPAAGQAARLAGFVVDASAVKAARRALALDWRAQAQGTLLPVTLEGSDDLRAWHPVATTQLVDLRSGDQQLRQNRIELSGDASRYFRLQWPAGQAGIEVLATTIETGTIAAAASHRQWSAAAALLPGEQPMSFVFESPGLPVDSLRLHLPDRNTVTPVIVEHRPDSQSPWREAGSTVAYRMSRDGQELESPPIAVCCGRDHYWRLRFDTRGGGIGHGTPVVELGWTALQGIFVARGDGPFRLAYGNAALTPSAYPVATLIPGYQPGMLAGLPAADFGAAIAQAEALPADDGKRGTHWISIALWAILIGGVLLLAAMVWRLLGQLNKTPPA